MKYYSYDLSHALDFVTEVIKYIDKYSNIIIIALVIISIAKIIFWIDFKEEAKVNRKQNEIIIKNQEKIIELLENKEVNE